MLGKGQICNYNGTVSIPIGGGRPRSGGEIFASKMKKVI